MNSATSNARNTHDAPDSHDSHDSPDAQAIKFDKVSKSFPGNGSTPPVQAVTEVSFSVARGEMVAIIGPSGCGKSTLLNMGAGLSLPSLGQVRIDGQTVLGPNRHVAFMLQKDLLMPWRTIAQNVEYGLELRGIAASQRTAISSGLLKQCRIEAFAGSYPHQLSGGMRQRAALARTLAVDPQVLLMDEPFSAVDAQTKMLLQQDLARTVSEQGKTAVFITHDLTEAVVLSDRVLIMSERPGRIVKQMTIDLPDRQAPMARRKHPRINDYVAQLMQDLRLDECI